jgi:hypothetical protein
METDIVIREVEEIESRSGNVRYVVRAADGREYTTFRPRIGQQARRYEGKRAHISYHEEDRGGFHNVYIDDVTPAPSEPVEDRPSDHDGGKTPDEAGWDTAVEAAPWLVGTDEPTEPVPPKRLYERLRPFKDLVADDIREGHGADKDDEPGDGRPRS